MCAASNWLWNFAIGYASKSCCRNFGDAVAYIVSLAPYLVNGGAGNANLGVKVFFIWGTTCLCCVIFAYFCIPETKGASFPLPYITLDPINDRERIRPHPRASRHHVPEHHAYAFGRVQQTSHQRERARVRCKWPRQNSFAPRGGGEIVDGFNRSMFCTKIMMFSHNKTTLSFLAF